MTANIPEFFCVAPWTHTYSSPQGERRLCCASREEARFQQQYIDQKSETQNTFSPDTLATHWNSPYMKDIRQRMLAGERIPQCEVCNSQRLNLHTYRSYFNNTLFPHKVAEAIASTDSTGFTTMEPVSYDYRISNKCNFKCRMCGEQLSSAWEAEKRKHNMWDPKHDKWMLPENRIPIRQFQEEVLENELWAAVKDCTIEEIYWVGGEPLMWETHWEVMQYLVESGHSKDVTVRYNTNLSVIERSGIKLYDLLPHFKSVNLCASIDGAGDIGEYIRTGLQWDNWLTNFKQGLFLNSLFGDNGMVLDITLTLPGLFSMKEMIDLANELDVKAYLKITFSFDSTVLMSPMSLPRAVLDDILSELIEYCTKHETVKTKVFRQTFESMRSRLVFEDEYTDYLTGFKVGKQRLLNLEAIRNSKITMEHILANHTAALAWWSSS